ncbi:glycosyltransferase family 61 protein [Microbacterium marinilacus]|nr:glycosyltransferase 61 family protein [Microbacterium marinilacus]MBY0687204.1 glycosyltransferase family 61 protein [Microbacterium marinilacus]
MDRLATRLVTSAVVYPVVTRDDRPDELLMGVFDGDGEYVDRTATDRRSGLRGSPIPQDLLPEIDDGDVPEAVYAGDLHMHYGHFLLESLARLWYAAEHPELPIVWTAAHSWGDDESFRPWQREILDILGLTNPVRFVTRPTRFAALHVPDIGYRYDDWIHPDHARFLARHVGPPREPGRRIWLSRSAIDSDVRDVSAEAAERHLRAAGWFVIHPERLSVREQLDHLSRAEVIAGEEGSAFHGVLLLAELEGRRLRVIRRRGPEHRNFRTIGEARGLEQDFHSLAGERILRAEGREVTKVNRSAAALLDALDEPPALPSPPRPGDRAAAAVARSRGVSRLLVVGARTAYPAATSGARTALVVSTRLEEDPRAYRSLAGRVDELPFAQYAELFVTEPQPYELIRVCGDDASAVVRDVDDTAAFSDEGTVWLLDDDVPGNSAAAELRARGSFAVHRESVGDDAVLRVERA